VVEGSDHSKVNYVQSYGIRNAKGEPLTKDTVMYGASLTKTVFVYTVMQLVDQGKLKLDTPIKDDLDKPLPTQGAKHRRGSSTPRHKGCFTRFTCEALRAE